MRIFVIAFFTVVSLVSFGMGQSGEINVIPKPSSVTRQDGSFVLDRNTVIVAKGKDEKKSAAILAEALGRSGTRLKTVSKAPKKNYIQFMRSAGADPGPEAYSLDVQPQGVTIQGSPAGQFYAVQTLLQLLPADFNTTAELPAVRIDDAPRFQYRGMHLDVSRHFFPVEFVKKYIDLMAMFKFNKFHWHLTDDQGWRIEIKKYPKLTAIGSKRPETVKERNLSPYIGDGVPVEGFYTQDQIRDVVAYAKSRHITVIPEIELPGHASAAIAAYPELGCKTAYQYKVQTTWGIFKEVFCPTDTTFKFLEDVIDETIALFPDSPYIHIGGDEVLKDHWKESAFVQDLKKRENLKDEHEVQSYFIRRMEKYINSKGKKIIGWDEILEGGLAPNATVMSWRGMRGGIEAAKAKHDVIMTPTEFAYLNFGQGDPAYEPLTFPEFIPLDRVYRFDPVPPDLTADEAKYILGGQGNLWAEYIKTPAQAEYQLFPRMLAMSEVLWSRKEDRDKADFMRRMNAVLPRLDRLNVNYRIPEAGGLANIVTNDPTATIRLVPAERTRVFYTLDGSVPSESSTQYGGPISVDLAAGDVKTLKTIVVLPNGRKSHVYAATIVRGAYREPDATDASKPGVGFEFLTPDPDPSKKSAVEVGETRSILLTQFAPRHDLKKPFTVQLDGYFRAPADGVYEFQLESTWDGTVMLGDKQIIANKNGPASARNSALVPLKAGLHKMILQYKHGGGDLNFRFRWAVKGEALRQAYGSEFVH